MTDKAWHLCDPGAERAFKALRKAGVRIAVVSNFDTRLRPLLQALKCDHWFDAVAVSAEVAAEKPNPTIFLKACELLGVKPEDVVHVGDDRRNDVWGARDAGCDAWLWGVTSTLLRRKKMTGEMIQGAKGWDLGTRGKGIMWTREKQHAPAKITCRDVSGTLRIKSENLAAPHDGFSFET
ncbi:unnamed protein product [Spirodela intermedia]|uniref:Uncharacterized protein n=1 Tax=Spirodela intermedia TaxID=51605 RepID=A0A7I8IZY6_SPIIN|nr:unnamed protein product [Spirodela intermedia]CAA6663534.1 unnamed protein product [Spirodela intermedia]